LIFSGGGGNDEGSAIANSIMHASADDDRGDPPQGPPHPPLDWSHQCSLVIRL
nr:hypothetical protein [Tanacetum cinerariifolium]